jgi:hypothetical protein
VKRREFFKMIAGASAAYYTLSLTACGPAAPGAALRVDVKDGDTVTIYDMEMEGWSTLGSGYLGPTGELKAQAVKDNKTITLPYVQDDHGHEFTLTAEHFAALRKGKKISIETTEAQGHTHEVRIDPKTRVEGSAGITMPVDPSASAQSADDKVYAALTDNDKTLYVAGSSDFDESSVEYCADTVAKCDADASLWNGMMRHAPRQDKQIFMSMKDLVLDDGKSELPLNIRGKAKKDGRALRFALKLMRR